MNRLMNVLEMYSLLYCSYPFPSDINECMLYGGTVCTIDSTCENTPGSFRCNCKQGFQTAEDGRFCKGKSENNMRNIVKKGQSNLRRKKRSYFSLAFPIILGCWNGFGFP